MEAPIPDMGNFWIPCTIKVGTLENSTTGKPNWGDTTTWEDWVIDYANHAGTAGSVQRLPAGQAT
jgi:hypothetical protein